MEEYEKKANNVDLWVYSVLIIGTLLLLTPLVLPVADWMLIVGDVVVVVSHMMAIPAFLILLGYMGDNWYNDHIHGIWYIFVLSHSFIASISYHVVMIIYVKGTTVDGFDAWDISAQNLLLSNTLVLLAYDGGSPPPFVLYIVTVILAVIVAWVGNVDLDLHLFEVFAMIVFALLSFYVFSLHFPEQRNKCCTMKPEFRDKCKLATALVLALFGCVAFVIASRVDRREYALIHSVWHLYAYSLLYLILRSIKKHDSDVEMKASSSPKKYADPFIDVDAMELDREHLLKL